MRALVLLLLALLTLRPSPGLCLMAEAPADVAPECCVAEPVPPAPVAPQSEHGGCCGEQMRCDMPCHATLALDLPGTSWGRFETVALGTWQTPIPQLHGIRISPEPRPPDASAA